MAKKSFKENLGSVLTANPALAFITPKAQKAKAAKEPKAKPVRMEVIPPSADSVAAPAYQSSGGSGAKVEREAKSRRLQSLLKPSLHDFLKRSAERRGVSPNDRLNALLEAARLEEEGI